MLATRLPDGVAVIENDDYPVVAADALALISGVNFKSIIKVIAAIEVLAKYSGTDVKELTKLANVPLDRVEIGNREFAEREENTRYLCEDISASDIYNDYESLLHLRERMLQTTER